jgi:hypothetical protein
VEVNQRALIDKVLARYSGEFTVFRELLQNSDDAQATAVEIHFETQKYMDGKNFRQSQDENLKTSLPDLKTTLVWHISESRYYSCSLRDSGTSVDLQEQRDSIQGRRLEPAEKDWYVYWAFF